MDITTIIYASALVLALISLVYGGKYSLAFLCLQLTWMLYSQKSDKDSQNLLWDASNTVPQRGRDGESVLSYHGLVLPRSLFDHSNPRFRYRA